MKRRFGLVSAAALVVANMIGVGVFTTSGFALADLGRPEPVLLAWLLGGLLALCGAVSYGALARHIPESGGEYTLLSRTVHPLAGFLAGWISQVRDPERNLQRSLWLATGTVTAIYLALNAVFLYSAPLAELAGRAEIGAIAAEAIGGRALRHAVSVLISLALFTSISSMVMAGPRVYARMAEDGLFPRLFVMGEEVPKAAVALQVGLAVGVVWVSELLQLLGYIGFTLSLSAAATVGGLIALRQREGPERVPVPGYPWVPGAFMIGTLGAAGFMATQRPFEAGVGLLTIFLGVPMYWLMRRSRNG